jgi:SulP family sulfate permease
VAATTDVQGIKHYQVKGYLFFASVQNFLESFDAKGDPQEVYIDFAHSRIMDHSGLEAVHALTEKYLKQGKIVHLYHLSDECRQLVKKAEGMVQVNVRTGPLGGYVEVHA